MRRDLIVGEVLLDCFAGRKVQSVRKRQLPNRKAASLGVGLLRNIASKQAGLQLRLSFTAGDFTVVGNTGSFTCFLSMSCRGE